MPKDILSCRNSGFVDTTVTEVLALRNPASEVGCHILDTVLKLTKNFIDMFKLRSNPALTKVFDMLDIGKKKFTTAIIPHNLRFIAKKISLV